MNDNPLVKTKQFWLKLLKLKIKSALESKADKESKKLFKEEKENEKLLQEKKSKEKEEPQKLNNSTMGFEFQRDRTLQMRCNGSEMKEKINK